MPTVFLRIPGSPGHWSTSSAYRLPSSTSLFLSQPILPVDEL